MQSQIDSLVLGNEIIIESLTKLARKVKLEGFNLTGSFIFTGSKSTSKKQIAKHFIKSLVCDVTDNHRPCNQCQTCQQIETEIYPDFFSIAKNEEKKNISVEEVREFIRLAGTSAFFKYRIGIIEDAETLSIGAANALLKTLEEPSTRTIIILITDDLNNLPKTIISRSQVFNFRRATKKKISEYLLATGQRNEEEIAELALLADGSIQKGLAYSNNQEFFDSRRSAAKEFFEALNASVAVRLELANKVLATKETGQEVTAKTKSVLDIWQGVARDLLIAASDDGRELIVNKFLVNELKARARTLGVKKIINLCQNINQAESLLKSNVNPHFVLDNIMLNIN